MFMIPRSEKKTTQYVSHYKQDKENFLLRMFFQYNQDVYF